MPLQTPWRRMTALVVGGGPLIALSSPNAATIDDIRLRAGQIERLREAIEQKQ